MIFAVGLFWLAYFSERPPLTTDPATPAAWYGGEYPVGSTSGTTTEYGTDSFNTGGLDETECAGTGQFVTIDVAGEVDRHLEHDVLHQREVVLDHLRQFGLHRARTLGRSHSTPTGSRAPHPLFLFALVHRPGISLGRRWRDVPQRSSKRVLGAFRDEL